MTSFTARSLWLVLALLAVALVAPVFGEEAAAEAAPAAEAKESTLNEAGEETDETKLLLKQLTIAMASEVVDERTVMIRDTGAKAGKKNIHLRLGNVGPVPRGSLNDADYAEKVNVAKAALQKLVDKQMLWYKAAPEALQTLNSEDADHQVMLVDIWSIDGRHISTALKKDGHLAEAQEYEQALAKDILTVAAEEEKKDSYKKLEEALKESEQAKQEAAKATRAQQEAEEQENVEGFGLGGWAAMAVLVAIVIGAATNFGRESNKKVNLNRKKGPFEKFWMKLKGA